MPSTSVSTTSLCACSATASAAAAVSALMLRTWPSTSRSGATVETTGIRPASRMSCTAPGFTVTTSPTSPRSTSSPSGAEQACVLARETDGHGAVLVEQADQLTAHLTREHHADDVHHLGGRDTQATAELAL